jgi:hypothetical protein
MEVALLNEIAERLLALENLAKATQRKQLWCRGPPTNGRKET